MSKLFGSTYANVYDSLYQDKDYVTECDLIEQVFEIYGEGNVQNVLDLGCGSGNHAIPLGQRGYRVVGVDSSPAMLKQARRKKTELADHITVEFRQGDLRSLELGQRFDATLMMFAVLGYQAENGEVLSALQSARNHLHPKGILICDFWYGPAVLNLGPSQRVKAISIPKGKTLRVASAKLDIRRHVCEETHHVRFFFPLELELFLEASGFIPLRLTAFPEIERKPDETTWNVLQVARAV
jgi:SAM-dependent methyltransferase